MLSAGAGIVIPPRRSGGVVVGEELRGSGFGGWAVCLVWGEPGPGAVGLSLERVAAEGDEVVVVGAEPGEVPDDGFAGG